jgi:hypothetical protein
MQKNKETRIMNMVCILLVVTAGFVRPLMYDEPMTYNAIICVLFIAAAFIWILQLKRRLIQSEVRRNLIAVAWLIIFWIALRTLKYIFLPDGYVLTRYVWYLYYVPQIFCVLLMFFSVLYIGRPYDSPISSRWKFLYIPAVMIVVGIMTNDLHQIAFRFPEGSVVWSSRDYSHGPLYFIAMLWIVFFFVAMLIVVFVRCAVPQRRKNIWIPMVPLGIGILYIAGFFLKPDNLLSRMFTVPEIGCVVFTAFIECLVQAHLLPSNDQYGDFWNASSIGAGIMDKEGVVHYMSECSVPVTPKQVQEAQKREVLLEDGNISLRSQEIRGGYGYWTRDISEINHLNRELAEMGDVLAEENAMLDAENKLAENRIRIEQQNALYDSLAKSVSTQLESLDALLSMSWQEEEEFEQTMKYACILNSYIKRHSNLQLLLHQNRKILGDELRLAIAESLEYVRLYGIKTYGSYRIKGSFLGEAILTAYEVFEAVLEAGIPGTNAVLVNLDIAEGCLTMRMELDAPREILNTDVMAEKVNTLHGRLDVEVEMQTEYVTLVLSTGGEGI